MVSHFSTGWQKCREKNGIFRGYDIKWFGSLHIEEKFALTNGLLLHGCLAYNCEHKPLYFHGISKLSTWTVLTQWSGEK